MRKEDYIVGSFAKQYRTSLNEFNVLFHIHKGFSSTDNLKELLKKKKIDYSNIIVIKFCNMYYGIVFEDYNKSYIIGALKTYYVNDKYILIGCNTDSLKMKFTPTYIKKQIYKHQTLAYDLLGVDCDLDVFHNDISILEYEYSKTYAIILGLTFVDYYFSINEMFILNTDYFSEDYSHVINGNVIGINPFKGKVMLSNGSIRNHQFYFPVY